VNDGFVRIHCKACGESDLVGLSCKQRMLCPSCGAKRTAETAAHLVDRVLPDVRYRQWTVSVPFGLRRRLARDVELRGEVHRLAVSELFRSIRRRAGHREAQGGAVTFVQTFGSALNAPGEARGV
jgi:hypothetical protein